MSVGHFRSPPEALKNWEEAFNQLSESLDRRLREPQKESPAHCRGDEGCGVSSGAPECAVQQESSDQDREEACPDESLDDVRVLGHELLELRVRLALLEKQFDLPAEPIKGRH